MNDNFDVIIIGGGHAGTEAALASARSGARTLLLTQNIDTLGQMSCNPAIGGIGKGHLVKEIDALGGVMAWATDHAGIQFRTLNASKGPAVRATRAQADRALYKKIIREVLEHQENLSLFQQGVEDLIIENNCVTGVVTQMGLAFHARAIVLTVGTFLAGKIHIGFANYQGGRAGDPPANALAQRLRALPFNVARLKTGTPPRIDGRTIDYSKTTAQPGDQPTPVFSYLGHAALHPEQVNCYLTYTSEKTHDIIRRGLDRSPLYTGKIEGVGPRYCPSIEDKIVRFADKAQHQIFIEPEGLSTTEIYPNGISTSLPYDIQVALVRSIAGFENAAITRPGYAIEYDFFDPRDLTPSLQTQCIQGLFFAGQINGTTGYEEAAAQGLIAGINAARYTREEEPFILKRDEAYIGVLIDDLITQGTTEPYRMFTSRAEYRLLLREDNADLRLTEKGYAVGLVNAERWRVFNEKRETIEKEQTRLAHLWVRPNSLAAEQLNPILVNTLTREYRCSELLRRPELSYTTLMNLPELGPGLSDPICALQVEIQAKYAGYIQQQEQEIERQRQVEDMILPPDFPYHHIKGLSHEVSEKLRKVQPTSIGMASRIPGMTPAAISLLLVYLKKYRHQRDNAISQDQNDHVA